MSPISFHESNVLLRAPKSMEGECGDLHVHTNGELCISCWQPTPEEIASMVAGNPVWLVVVSGETQPPVSLSTLSPFLLHGEPHG